MDYTLHQLSQLLNLRYTGNGDIRLNHICSIEDLRSGGLAFITNPSELSDLPTPTGIFDSRQRDLGGIRPIADAAIIVPESVKSTSHNLIYSTDPVSHHIEATGLLHDFPKISSEIHKTAVIGDTVSLGKNVTIDPNVVIYDNVMIGDNCVIRAGCVVMEKTKIGSNTMIYPNVTIRENCQIGDRVIIHSGTVIGSDGFGFYQRSGRNRKIPQIGGVIIGDDVEIGACVTIDRARFTNTVIKAGSKLDNLIHIAHNVELGDDSLIAAQSGIAGSTTTGDHLMMGGQSGIRDNLKIGSQVTLLARTLLTSKTNDNSIVAGMPSRPINEWRNVQALISSLEGLYERVKSLEKKANDTEN